MTTPKSNAKRQIPKTGRKRLSAVDRRDQLIRVAVELFSKHGFDGTTTKSIAAEAGVSEAILYHHFATKEDLYAAILDYKANAAGVEEWLDELRGAASRNDDQAVFRSLGEKILESYREDPNFQRLMFYSALEGHAISKVFHQRRGLPIFDFLRDYVAKRQQDGAFRDCDPGTAVFALVSAPTYYAIVKRLFGLDVLTLSEADLISTFTDLFLDGLRNGPATGKARKHEE